MPNFFKFTFNWRIIALQDCVSLCHTSTWISHRHSMSPPSWTSLPPPTPSHSSRLSQSTWFELPASYSKFPLAIYFACGNVYVSGLLSIHSTLFFPHCVHMSVLYVCISVAALPIGSSVPSFYIPYICAAAATAKSFQSCPTLYDAIDGSPPGSPVPGILQARTLEWVAISFSNTWKWKVKVKSLSRVRPSVTPWTAAHQAPRPWDFPGKSTGVGCHCLLRYICANIWYLFFSFWLTSLCTIGSRFIYLTEVKWSESHSVVSDSLQPHGL